MSSDLSSVSKRIFHGGNQYRGFGWAALARCGLTGRLLIMQIEKHNVHVYPSFASC